MSTVVRDRVPHCRFVAYEGLQHNITHWVPERCADELARFLRATGGREA